MADEWETLTLRDAGVALIDCDHRTPPPADSGYPYVAIPQLRNGHIDLRDARRIAPGHFVEWTRKAKPTANDVILSRRCNPGETAYVPAGVEFALGQNLVMLRADGKRVYPPFLRWLTRSPEWWEQVGKFLNVGAVFDSLKCADVPRFELCIPPLPEQRAIASLLGALDDKIELNRQMNETLEATARLFFKDWFVDFGPTRAKAEGRARQDGARSGQPRKPLDVASGLPWPVAEAGAGAEGKPYLAPELWALFPDALDDEDKPAGWSLGSLSDLARLNPESWTSQTMPQEVQYVDLSNTKWGQIEQTQAFDRCEAPSRAQRILRPGDTIVGTVRPGNGSYALISEDGLTGSTGFSVLRPKQQEYREIVYLASTSKDNIEALTHLADGAAYPAVRPDVVAAQELVLPDGRCLTAFSEATAPIIDMIEANKAENKKLAQTRDLLLPKLMSGEIRLRDAEKLVAEAL